MAKSHKSNGKPAKGLKLKGTNGDDVLIGGAGNDVIYGRDGNDFIDGGDGNDYLNGGDGNNTIVSASGNNRVRAEDGDNLITTGDGNDTIYVDDGNNVINAGGGRNRVRADDGNNVITTGDGNDDIRVDDGNNVIDAGGGNNRIHGDDGNNIVTTGDGNDHIHLDDGDNIINAGGGRNYIRADDGNNQITTGDGDDYIRVDDGDNVINAGGGRNYVRADDGNNQITTGDGNDDIRVDDGNNVINAGGGNNRIHADDGNNQITTGNGRDHIHLDDGNNVISSGSGDDDIRVDDGNNVIDAGSGNNDVRADDGNNQITAGDGNDDIRVDDGNNVINAGGGNNRIHADDGNNQITTGDGRDHIHVDDGDNVINAGGGNDVIKVGRGSNVIEAGDGDDKVFGGRGDDTVDGGAGNDWIFGHSGDDVLTGGAGNDWLKGHSGNDTLIYVAADNGGNADHYAGGSGIDTLLLDLTFDEWLDADVQADIADFLTFIADNTNSSGQANGRTFEFDAFDLDAKQFEDFRVTVDDVEVTPEDDAVTANDDSVTTTGEHAIVTGSVLDNDDVPDLVASVELLEGPALGNLTFNADGTFSYDPGNDFDSLAFGQSASQSFTYRVTDADGDSDTATVAITITGTNDAPVANVDTAAATEDTAQTILAADLLANDTDVDAGDTRSIESVGNPVNGTVALDVDGNVVFTPAANFSGDASFDYTIIDSQGARSTATVSIAVAAVADAPTLTVQDSPVSAADQIPLNIAAALNDTDGSEVLSITIEGLPAGSQLNAGTANPDGSFTLGAGDLDGLLITPPANAPGEVTVQVTATARETSNNDTASVNDSLTVTFNRPPDAVDDAIDIFSDHAASANINVLANDTDPDNDTLTIASVDAVSALGFNLVLTATGEVAYDAGATFIGLNVGDSVVDTFNYTIVDENGASDSAVATITIHGDNEAPVAETTAITGNEDVATTGALQASDVDNTNLTFNLVAGPAAGNLNILSDGSYTFDPVGAFESLGENDTADLSFTYSVSDGIETVEQTASLTVQGENDASLLALAPSGGGTPEFVEDGAPLAVAAGLAVSDVDSATLDGATVSITAGFAPGQDQLAFTAPGGSGITGTYDALSGALTLSGTASLSDYQAALASVSYENTSQAPAAGPREISIQVDDGAGAQNLSNAVTATIDVISVNDDPTVDQGIAAQTVAEESALNFTIPADAFADVDGDTLTFTAQLADGNPLPSWISFDGQTFTGNPDDPEVGQVSIEVTADDGNGSTVSTTFDLTVTEVNDIPVVTAPASASTNEDTLVAIPGVSVDDDRPETVNTVTITAPAGAIQVGDTSALSSATGLGTAQIVLVGAVSDINSALQGLSFAPPLNADGNFDLTIVADDGSGQFNPPTVIPVDVTAVADTPFLTAQDVTATFSGGVGTANLDIQTSLRDLDGSEAITSITLLEVPTLGVTFNAGQNNGDGSFTFTEADLSGLTMSIAPGTAELFTVIVQSTSTEASTGQSAVAISTFSVTAIADQAINGTPGADLLTGGSGEDTINGLGGDDLLNGGGGNDQVNGGDGNDILLGGTGDDVMDGGAGVDLMTGGAGDDVITGGLAGRNIDTPDFNIASYDDAQDSVTVTISAQGTVTSTAGGDAAGIGTDTLIGIDKVIGSDFDDVVTVDGLQSGNFGQFFDFQGGGGDDLITVTNNNSVRLSYQDASAAIEANFALGRVFSEERADSTLFGDAASLDAALAGSGTDLSGTGIDSINNLRFVDGSSFDDILIGSDDDVFESFRGRAGDDFIDGGGSNGTNRADYINSAEGVIVNLSAVTQFEVASGQAKDGFGTTDTLVNINQVRGSRENADILIGGSGDESFRLLGGDDLVIGGAGNDWAEFREAGVGDVIANISDAAAHGVAANRAQDGAGGFDTILEIENLRSGGGNDILVGSDEANSLRAGAGNDLLEGRDGDDVLNADAGDDTLDGGAGDDFLADGSGNDLIIGGEGSDTALAGAGDDVFNMGTDADGFDVVSFSVDATGGILYTGGAVTGEGTVTGGGLGTNTLTGVDRVEGTNFADTFTGGAGDESFTMLAGNDQVDGGAGFDELNYKVDNLTGGSGITVTFSGQGAGTVIDQFGDTDIFTGIEKVIGSNLDDIITGAAGDEMIVMTAGADALDGGDGTDTLAAFGVSNPATGVTINLGTGQVVTGNGDVQTAVNFEDVIGSDLGDTITGSIGQNTLWGGDGDDDLDGFAGDDTLIAGAGNDTLDGGAGNDTAIFSGNIADFLIVETVDGAIVVADLNALDGNEGTNILNGIETITFADGVFTPTPGLIITGTPADDFLVGGGAGDTINGLGGNDVLDGTGGSDSIFGDDGNDTLIGGLGNDVLDGGAGTDLMIGGAGDDVIKGGLGGNNLSSSPDFNIASFQGAQAGLTVVISAQGTVTSTAGNDAAGIGTDTLIGVDKVIGSNFDDIVTIDDLHVGNFGQFFDFQGGGGDDLITVTNNNLVRLSYRDATAGIEANFGLGRVFSEERADSTLFADAASLDAALAGSATDLSGTGIDSINNIRFVEGSSFDDILIGSDDGVFESFRGGAGDDFIDGGGLNGVNRVDYANSTNGVLVNLSDGIRFGINAHQASDGFGSTDTLVNITQVRGSRTNADILIGGNGDESFRLMGGNDLVDGGAGNDWAEFREAGTGDVIANLSNSAAHGVVDRGAQDGAGGIDRLFNIENLRTGDGNDILVGGTGASILRSGDGNDLLEGMRGDDTLLGEAGDDTLDGGADNDFLTGGSGDDTFLFRTGDDVDTISDFTAGQGTDDVIDLSAVANAGSLADVLGFATQIGEDVRINFGGGDRIELQGVNLLDLHDDDFLF